LPDLKVDTKEVEGVLVVYPRGFINAHTVQQFERTLNQAIEAGRVQIVINGSGLVYIASAGLGAIMGVVGDVRSRGGDIRLTDLNDTVLNILEVVGFSRLYRLFDSEREAVESFTAAPPERSA
jgi:anti-sigma B factor antagonist